MWSGIIMIAGPEPLLDIWPLGVILRFEFIFHSCFVCLFVGLVVRSFVRSFVRSLGVICIVVSYCMRLQIPVLYRFKVSYKAGLGVAIIVRLSQTRSIRPSIRSRVNRINVGIIQ